MKALIRTTTVYSTELPSAQELETILSETGFTEPMQMQAQTTGFVIREGSSTYVETFPGGLCFTARIDTKVVPPSALKEGVKKLVAEIEDREGRKVGGKERRQLKSEVRDSLLAVALSRTTTLACFYHAESKLLFVPTTSGRTCDAIMQALIYAIGSLKTQTIHISSLKQGLTKRMNDWVVDENQDAFDGLYPRKEVVLKALDGQKVTVHMEELEGAREALIEALRHGFQVHSIGFGSPTGTEYRLTHDFKIRSITYSTQPVATSDGQEDDAIPFAEQAMLEVSELRDIVKFLCKMFDTVEAAKEAEEVAQ